jgi:hypothetical protein
LGHAATAADAVGDNQATVGAIEDQSGVICASTLVPVRTPDPRARLRRR